MQCLLYLLNILIVSLQEEVRTVLTHPMVKWISEPATWASEITVPQGICHLICRYISGYLQGRKQEMIDAWRIVWVEGKLYKITYVHVSTNKKEDQSFF
jgi:hypothetical protein